MAFHFTPAERLHFIMMAEQHEALGIHQEIDAGLVKRAILSDCDWGLLLAYPTIFERDTGPLPEHVSFVMDVLDMWEFVELEYERLDDAGKQRVKDALPDFVSLPPEFPGFDGNNESQLLGAAVFLVKDLDRFSHFAGRSRTGFNSHRQMREVYEKMVPWFKEYFDGSLSADQIADILSAPYKS